MGRGRQLKLVRELSKEIVSTILDDYTVVIDSEFFADLDEQLIGIAPFKINKYEQSFMDYIHSTYSNAPQFPNFLYSILHEIGHVETENEMEEVDEDTLKHYRGLGVHEYYRLHDETIATEWAVNFMLENQVKCEEWDKRYQCIATE